MFGEFKLVIARLKRRRFYNGCFAKMKRIDCYISNGRCNGFISTLCYTCPHYIKNVNLYCDECRKYHTMDCPNSFYCHDTQEKPHFVPRKEFK